MIKALVGWLVKSLLDMAVMCAIIAGLLGYLAYKILRRTYTQAPDSLDRFSAPLATGLALVARHRARQDDERHPGDDLPYFPGPEEWDLPDEGEGRHGARDEPLDWSRMVV